MWGISLTCETCWLRKIGLCCIKLIVYVKSTFSDNRHPSSLPWRVLLVRWPGRGEMMCLMSGKANVRGALVKPVTLVKSMIWIKFTPAAWKIRGWVGGRGEQQKCSSLTRATACSVTTPEDARRKSKRRIKTWRENKDFTINEEMRKPRQNWKGLKPQTGS